MNVGEKRVLKFKVKSRYLELLIAATFVVLLIYVASFTVRITRGISRTIEPPANQVRLQVLNACGVSGLAAKFADELSGYSDDEMEIKIVDTDNFTTMNLDSSFVISRVPDRGSARLFARRLGLDDEAVIYKALDEDYRNVTVTLVLGADYERLESSLSAKKEN